MLKTSFCVLHVVIHAPLRRSFDYILTENISDSLNLIGCRVLAPFGRKQQVGIIIAIDQQTDIPVEKLKSIDKIIDTSSIFPPKIFELLLWASRYYHHPLGDVLFTALPQFLRAGKILEAEQKKFWCLTSSSDSKIIKRLTAKQKMLVQLFDTPEQVLSTQDLHQQGIKNSTLSSLEEKKIIKSFFIEKNSFMTDEKTVAPDHSPSKDFSLSLTDEQKNAIQIISQHQKFGTFVLQGVTGSGKTEVYLQCIEKCLAENKQALVLIPEIGLTPQTVSRFRKRFTVPTIVMHSNLTEKERLEAWQEANSIEAKIIIGTRSAIFAPLQNLGIIVLDEEHDLSFKQQSGFRYHARDLAIVRAQLEDIPIILGSATPSLETYYNLSRQHYKILALTKRVANAMMPSFQLIDMRQHFCPDGLAATTINLIRQHLEQDQQVLVFLNRRGFAPLLMCHGCGWVAECKRCDAKYTLHQHTKRLQCHHCDSVEAIPSRCPHCQQTALFELGFGTERIEQTIKNHFPDVDLIRIDRDTTRKKGSMQNLLAQVTDNKKQILIGTQMLAKGHHFPNVTLVVVVNVDNGLHSLDFRATERLGQLIIQVAGRAGRGEKPGLVALQTHTPEHPLLQMLLQEGYLAFLDKTLAERKMAKWPPYSHLALIRAEAKNNQLTFDFLQEASLLRKKLMSMNVEIMGPVPSSMEKKAGLYRAQLLIQSSQRSNLQNALSLVMQTLGNSKKSSRVRWSLDVDPQEL